MSWNFAIGFPNCSRVCAYASACSYAPIAQPTASQATNARVIRKTRAVSRKVKSFCRRFSSGTRQLLSVISAFCTTRNAILF